MIHIYQENKSPIRSNIDHLINKIPDSRMEQYINEYYNNGQVYDFLTSANHLS